jgi:hypothetical protein
MDQWRSLRSELNKEAETIFVSSGEIVLIESSDESDSELMLSGRVATLVAKVCSRAKCGAMGDGHRVRFRADFRTNRSTGFNSREAAQIKP